MKRVVSLLASGAIAVSLLAGCNSTDYSKAINLLESGNPSAAREIFETLGDYKDSADYVNECDHQMNLQNAQVVVAKIDDIPITAPEEMEELIAYIRLLYDALNEDAKMYVTNYAQFETKETEILDAKNRKTLDALIKEYNSDEAGTSVDEVLEYRYSGNYDDLQISVIAETGYTKESLERDAIIIRANEINDVYLSTKTYEAARLELEGKRDGLIAELKETGMEAVTVYAQMNLSDGEILYAYENDTEAVNLLWELVNTVSEPRENNDFRGAQWGDDPYTVLKYDPDGVIFVDDNLTPHNIFISNIFVAGLPAVVNYYFAEDFGLYEGVYQFTKENYSRIDYISDYNRVKEALTETYGEPEEDKINRLSWLANYCSSEDQALAMGYISYLTSWSTETTEIYLGMKATDSRNILTLIDYIAKDYGYPINTDGL